MKNIALLSIAFALLVLAASIAYHAQTTARTATKEPAPGQSANGRYQISYVAGMTGVYMVDTTNGEISVCSPAYPKGCITIEEAHAKILQQRENAMNAAKSASDSIDSFTKDRAQDLRGIIDKFAPDKEPANTQPQDSDSIP